MSTAPAAPNHVQNYAYYGAGSNINATIPASYMAAHVDIVEGGNPGSDPFITAFKAAGGKLAFEYTDPTYMPYCPGPFTEPAGTCTGPIGNLVANTPSAWLHDSTGARLNRYDSAHYQYQEILNVGSPAAAGAFSTYVNNTILGTAPATDGVFADDSGNPYSKLFYNFSASSSVEMASDAQWIAAESTMLQAAGVKVIYNGGGNANAAQAGPAYPSQGAPFLTLPNVIGQNFEGCLSDSEGIHTSGTPNDDFLQNDLNGLLAVQAYDKLAVCMPTGPVDPASRLYVYAAYLLTYSPSYSVLAQTVNLSDNEAVYPETQLVPQQPLATATSNVAVLQKGNVYVREFAACSIASSPIGGCAALVNSSASSVTIPALAQSYAHTIVLDANSIYTGGSAHVVAGTPSTLGPASAAIFVR